MKRRIPTVLIIAISLFLAGCEASIGDNSGKTAAPTANAGNKAGEETVAGGKEATPTSAAVSATSIPVPTKASATQTPATQKTPEPEEPETVRKYGRIYTEHGADCKQRRERGRKHMDCHVHEPADSEL